jgi:hypothetical protein
MLGQILMEVRAELRLETEAEGERYSGTDSLIAVLLSGMRGLARTTH